MTHLLAEPETIYLFLQEPIYVLDEKIPVFQDNIEAELPEILPELQHEVLFVLPEKEENLPSAEAEQFRKIINWLNLGETDIYSFAEISKIQLLKNQKTKKCLSFGVDLSTWNEKIRLENYQEKTVEDTLFIQSEDLKTLSENPEKRKQLLSVLKAVFEK